MEMADPVDELTCFICRSIYTDPVSLKCGHSFCRACIHHVQDHHLVFGEHSCPICKMKIRARPLLPRNLQILHALQCYGGSAGEEVTVHCLYCVEAPVPAVKTCVQCETPLCHQHLEAHNKTLNHILIPPTATASLTYRKCSEHGNLLHYYCSQDAACVCESCCMTGNHRGHDLLSVNEAFNTELDKLNNFLGKIKLREKNINRRLQRMAKVRNDVRRKAQALRKKIKDSLQEVRKQLVRLEKKTNLTLYKEMKKISRPELTRRLHKRKETLSRKIRHVGELCAITDPIAFLQKVELDKELLRDNPDMEMEQNDDPTQTVDDLKEDIITAPLLRGLSQLVYGVYKVHSSNSSQYVSSGNSSAT